MAILVDNLLNKEKIELLTIWAQGLTLQDMIDWDKILRKRN